MLESVERMENLPKEPKIEFSSERIIADFLSYADMAMPAEIQKETYEWTLSSESARRYASALAQAIDTYGLEKVQSEARQIRDTLFSESDRLDIPLTAYAESITWAMWDLGKQYYFFLHPDENDPRYSLGNPFESNPKKDEIINRHLGWEAYAAFQNDEEFRSRIQNDTRHGMALPIFNEAPKNESDTLRSDELANLGKILRDT